MKIAHIIRTLDPLVGGPPIVVVRLAAELARQGHDVRVISHAAPDAQQRIAAMIGSLPGADLVRYQTVDSPPEFGELFRDMHIVHLHGVWDPILRSAAGAAAERKIPYVVAPHGMLDPWSLAQKKWKKKLALALGYRTMLNQAAFLHLLNRDEKDLIAPLRVTCKLEVIPNGIAPEEFSDLPPAGTFRAAHPEIGTSPYILFLSRMHYKKGLDILAAAFAQLVKESRAVPGPVPSDGAALLAVKNLHIVVAGGDDGAESDFRQTIQSLGLTARVHLVGPIFGREKLAALVDAACFCLPSRQEGFSIAILEAMACRLPVVISRACHFPEVAEQRAGEVVDLEPQAVADGLRRVLADPVPFGRAGHQLVFDKFTWPKVTVQLASAYQRCV